MQNSDNFLGEQLLLLASAKRYGYLETQAIIEYTTDSLWWDVPMSLDWIDGSGLSRYNQQTPSTIVYLLSKLYQEVGPDRLMSIFPAGGVSGTIKNWYAGQNGQPFIFAKTGTLRHVHCLSGYLRMPGGRMYVFSFMHNNYPGKIKELKEEMEDILNWLYGQLPQ